VKFERMGDRRGRIPAAPKHSTPELAREVGLTTGALHHILRRGDAPKPVRSARTDQIVNRGCNYYNRQEVLAYLRQIGVLK